MALLTLTFGLTALAQSPDIHDVPTSNAVVRAMPKLARAFGSGTG
jgi:hypothetical protein